MRFAVWILVLTAVLSLSALLSGELLPPAMADRAVFKLFELGDPFRSWWFRLLLGVLAISLFICVTQRGPRLVRQAFSRTFLFDPQSIAVYGGYRRIITENGEEAVTAAFHRSGLKVQRREAEGRVALSGTAGGLSRLGPLFNHTGMLLLILGGLAAGITGYSARITGSAGDTVALPEWGFELRIDDFNIVYYPISLNQWVELPDGRRGKVADISGDSALVELAPHQGIETAGSRLPTRSLRNDFLIREEGRPTPFQGNVRSYVTRAAVIVDGREVVKRDITVNHPLRYRGYRFYQTSFELGGIVTEVDSITVNCLSDELGKATVTLAPGGPPAALPWGGCSVAALRFLPDFRLDRGLQAFSASGELRNPAVCLKIIRDEGAEERWVFTQALEHTGGNGLPLQFLIFDLTGIRTAPAGYRTVLDVKREKGRWIIWCGFILMTIGLALIFSTSHRQAWAVVMKGSGSRDEVHLAGRSNRDAQRFQQSLSLQLSAIGGQQSKADS